MSEKVHAIHQDRATKLPDAVCPGSMVYGAEAPAFVVNPAASQQDLLSWCAVEAEQMQHLAQVGQNEFFDGDAALTVRQLQGRLHVLSGVVRHLAEMQATSNAQ